MISDPGDPSAEVTCTPGNLPTKASATEAVGTLANSEPLILEMAPVRFPRFCVPYPMTTTSFNSLFDSFI